MTLSLSITLVEELFVVGKDIFERGFDVSREGAVAPETVYEFPGFGFGAGPEARQNGDVGVVAGSDLDNERLES